MPWNGAGVDPTVPGGIEQKAPATLAGAFCFEVSRLTSFRPFHHPCRRRDHRRLPRTGLRERHNRSPMLWSSWLVSVLRDQQADAGSSSVVPGSQVRSVNMRDGGCSAAGRPLPLSQILRPLPAWPCRRRHPWPRCPVPSALR